MAQLAKVNIVYMSHIMRSNFTYHDSKTGENRAISERWFRQLADCIGLKPEKDYWPHVDTPQFKEIDMELREALATSAPRILLSGSGSGKTYTVECFRREFPSRVFVVSCNKLDRVNALIDKIAGTAGGQPPPFFPGRKAAYERTCKREPSDDHLRRGRKSDAHDTAGLEGDVRHDRTGLCDGAGRDTPAYPAGGAVKKEG